MNKRFLPIMAALLAVLVIVPAACAPFGDNVQGTEPTGATTGRLEVRVTDAPPEKKVTAVNVTVASVEINKDGSAAGEGGWQPLALSGANTFDLLKVQGLEQILATSDLTPGIYNQIRMEVTKVLVTFEGDQPVEAKLPSGKLKFVQGFEIAAGKTTVLLFDFDAAKSIHTTGNSKVMFQPVIKLNATMAPGALGIITPSLPNGLAGTAYTATLAAMGGTTPYTWSITTGTLPAGLTLTAATGIISGTPTAAGDSTFTVKVEDSFAIKKTAEKVFTISIAAAGTVQIVNTSLVDGTAGTAYSATVTALGGTAPLAWSVTTGILPAGLTLAPVTGVISGTPTAAGNTTFTITVTDASTTAKTDAQALTIHVVAAPAIQITTASLVNSTVGTAYNATVQAVGGVAPLAWSVTAGALPAGLTLAPTTGVISGTPTVVGDSAFTVTVTDHSTTPLTDAQALTIHVAAAP